MAKISYLGANLETTDTFAQWLARTNQITFDMGTVVMTSGAVAQPNNTNGAETTGNTHLEGIFSANTISVVGTLHGGTVSSPSTLSIDSNTIFSNSDIVLVSDTTSLFQANTDSLFTKNFTITAPANSVEIAANTFSSDTNSFTVISTLGSIFANTLTVGTNSLDTLTVESATNVVGPVTMSNNVTMSTITGEISIGTSQTTGQIIMGSLLGSGDISIGRSSNTQILNIGTGDIETLKTKTINIGTGGVAGSNTVINIGSEFTETNFENILRVNGNILLGENTNKINISYSANSAYTYSLPDVGANSQFILSNGNQTLAGTKTFSAAVVLSTPGTATTHAVRADRSITAGDGLTGGGNLIANRSFALENIAAGSTATGALYYNGTTISAGRLYGGTATPISTTRLNYDGNFYATNLYDSIAKLVNEQRILTAGDGLTGGGDLTANRSFAVDGSVIRTTGNQTIGGTKTFSSAVVLSTAGTATTHAVRADRSITAGDGLTGGGNLTANRSFAVDATVVRTVRNLTAGDGLTGGGDLSLDRSFAVDATVVRTTRTLTAGDGLTGGGTLAANRTFAVDATVVRTSGTQTIAGEKTFSELSTFNGGVTVNGILFVDGDLIASGNTTLTVAESDIERLRIFNTLEFFGAANIISNMIPGTTSFYDLGSSLSQWNNVYTSKVILGSQATGATEALRADRTLQFVNGQNITITGAGTGATNLTANRSWTISAANTDLNTSSTSTTRTITSSTGSNVVLPAASSTLAGVMTAADRIKLDGVEAGAQVNVGTNLGTITAASSRTITSSTGSNVSIPAANSTIAGVMTAADRIKLDGVEAGAQVNIGTNLGIVNGTTAGPTITSSTGSNTTFPSASETISGAVTTGTQTFAGTKTFTSTINGSISGNSGSATTLQTSRTINGTPFNGSSNITTASWGAARNIGIGNTTKSVNGSGAAIWTLAEIGAADRTLSLTAGDGLTGGGDLTANRSFAVDGSVIRTTGNQTIGGTKTFSSAVVLSTAGTATTHAVRADRSITAGDGLTGGGNLTANRSFAVDATVVRTSGIQTIAGEKTFSSTISGSINGNAATATSLQTARTISLSGDVTGSASFNGTSNITISSVVANDSHTHEFTNLTGSTNSVLNYSTTGYFEAGRGSGSIALTANDGHGNANITFNHRFGVPDQSGNSGRIEVNTDVSTGARMSFKLGSGTIAGTPVTISNAMTITETAITSGTGVNFVGNLTGNAATATTWSSPVSFLIGNTNRVINGDEVSVNWSLTDIGAAARGLSLTAGDGLSGGGDLTANRTFAVDATVVRTTGDQTIGGTKTFSNALILSTAGTATTHAVRADRTINTGTGLTGGGNLTANRTISVSIATLAEAEEGLINDKVMTPLRVKQAIAMTGWTTIPEVATTSGTAFDVTSIPAGTTDIEIYFNGVSLDGPDNLLVQLGDSGGIETTGYVSRSNLVDVANIANITAGHVVYLATAARSTTGVMRLHHYGNNLWVQNHLTLIPEITNTSTMGNGINTLSGELTQLRLTRTGTNNFDAGAFKVRYR